MKNKKILLAALLTMTFAAAPFAIAKSAGKGTWIVPACSAPKKATQNVLFGYMKPVEGGPGGGTLFPICLIDGKKISDVPYSQTPERKSFDTDFMRKGAQYNLYCAGKPTGKINSNEVINSDYESYLGCSINKAAKTDGLATNMTIASQAKSLPMRADERTKLKALATSTLKNSGVSNTLLKSLRFSGLEKIQSSKNAVPLLIVHAQVDEPIPEKSPITHSVFLVVNDSQSGMQKQICNVYHSTNDIGDGNQGIETYLGQLDLNADGIAEIVSRHDFAGSSAFRIYSKQNKKWKYLGTFGSYGPGC